jgi:hypothetical protein
MGEEQRPETSEPITPQTGDTATEGSDGQATQPEGALVERHLDVPRTDQEPPVEQAQTDTLVVGQAALVGGDETARDHSKEYSMALEGDPWRSRAAAIRKTVQIVGQTPTTQDPEELRQQIENTPGLNEYDKRSMQLVGKDAIEYINDGTGTFHRHDLSVDEGRARYIEEASLRAERLDNTASHYEEWARVVHEHPISKEYKDRCGFELTPSGLEDLEYQMLQKQELIDHLASEAKALSGAKIYEGLPFSIDLVTLERGGMPSLGVDKLLSAVRDFRHNYDEANRLTARYEELAGDQTNTLQQMSDFYSEVLEIAILTPMKNNMNIINAVLEDVKSGRASASSS